MHCREKKKSHKSISFKMSLFGFIFQYNLKNKNKYYKNYILHYLKTGFNILCNVASQVNVFYLNDF